MGTLKWEEPHLYGRLKSERSCGTMKNENGRLGHECRHGYLEKGKLASLGECLKTTKKEIEIFTPHKLLATKRQTLNFLVVIVNRDWREKKIGSGQQIGSSKTLRASICGQHSIEGPVFSLPYRDAAQSLSPTSSPKSLNT